MHVRKLSPRRFYFLIAFLAKVHMVEVILREWGEVEVGGVIQRDEGLVASYALLPVQDTTILLTDFFLAFLTI